MLSTTKEPMRRLAVVGPITASSGSSELRTWWLKITWCLRSPLDRAVLTKSLSATSSILVRISRENLAMVGSDRAMVGRMVWRKVVYRATGKTGKTMARVYWRREATTKLGMEMPMMATTMER